VPEAGVRALHLRFHLQDKAFIPVALASHRIPFGKNLPSPGKISPPPAVPGGTGHRQDLWHIACIPPDHHNSDSVPAQDPLFKGIGTTGTARIPPSRDPVLDKEIFR
jgi:hypothetical protein